MSNLFEQAELMTIKAFVEKGFTIKMQELLKNALEQMGIYADCKFDITVNAVDLETYNKLIDENAWQQIFNIFGADK